MPKLEEARRRNQRPFLRYNKLIIYDSAGSAPQPSDQPTIYSVQWINSQKFDENVWQLFQKIDNI